MGDFLLSLIRVSKHNQIQKWNSFVPLNRKLSLIDTLTHRAVNICSKSMLPEELKKIRSLFEDNGYPSHIVDSRIKKKISLMNEERTQGPQKHAVYLKLPYMGIAAEKMIKDVRNTVEETFYSVNFRAVFQTTSLISINKKDSISSQSKSNVIYKFNCKHCDSVYIGRSYRRLADRIKEHVPSVVRKAAQNRSVNPNDFSITEEGINSVLNHYRMRSRPVVQPAHQFTTPSSKSAIWLHLIENPACAASYDESCFKVLAQGRSKFHVDVLEGVFINTEKPILCRQKDFVFNIKLFKH